VRSFYRIFLWVLSRSWNLNVGRGGPYAEPAPALQQPIRSSLYVFILFVYSLHEYTYNIHVHTTSNNSIILYYNDGSKYVFVIFIFFHLFSIGPSVRIYIYETKTSIGILIHCARFNISAFFIVTSYIIYIRICRTVLYIILFSSVL